MRPKQVRMILAKAILRESTRLTIEKFSMCSVAMVWGMPLPCAPEKKRRVTQVEKASPAGTTTSIT